MKKISLLLLFMIFTLAAQIALAQVYRRDVEFEWDAIEGAKTYEVELKKAEIVLTFKTSDPHWAGLLEPGVYTMRIRAKDQRGVPASWSPPEEFKVGLETVKTISPQPKEQVNSQAVREAKVQFKWKPVGGAKSYVFEITSQDGQTSKKIELEETEISLELPVAQIYNWQVKAVSPAAESDEIALNSFSHIGQKIKKPVIETPENDFVREVRWSAPDFAASYGFALQRLNPKTKKWERTEAGNDLKEPVLNFDPKWPGGKYKLLVRAQGPLRENSERSEIEFNVRNGDRSAAAEEVFTIRQSIDRMSGWYTIASYLITMVDYQGRNFDRSNSILSYSAIGGTGRLGMGFLQKGSAWGFLGIADLSGINVEGSGNFTYASAEGNLVYRKNLSELGELRQSFGWSYKELPETIGRSSTTINETNLLKTMGPHYGIEYWHALSPKLGLQFNTHLYPSLLKISTPNGQPISPGLSLQVGFLGSYRLKRHITGLAGYAYRNDQINYQAQAGKGSAREGDINTVQLTGHYLNLFLEWAL